MKTLPDFKTFAALAAFVFSTALAAAPAAPAKPAAPATPDAPGTTSLGIASGGGGFIREWQLTAGLQYKPMFPLSANFSELMNAGYASFVMQGEVVIPKDYVKLTMIPFDALQIEPRAGFSMGYASFISKDKNESAAILNNKEVHTSINPWQVHLFFSRTFNMPPALKLRPYTGFGFGMSFSGSSATSGSGQDLGSTSSVDGAFSWALGTGVQLTQIKMVEFIAQLDVTNVFADPDGTFLGIAIGAMYKF